MNKHFSRALCASPVALAAAFLLQALPTFADPVLILPGRRPAPAASDIVVAPGVTQFKITKLPDTMRVAPIVGQTEKGEIDFVRESFDHAHLGKLGPGVDAAVYATMLISVPVSMQPANGNNVMYAWGRLTPAGSGASERLAGVLKVSTLSPSKDNPQPQLQTPATTIDFSVDAKGRATVLQKLGGKAYLGRPAATIQFGSTSKLLYAEAPYFASGSLVTVRLSNSISPLQVPPPPQEKPKPAPAAQPRGMRLRIDTLIKVTNGEDGPGDFTCEVYGSMSLGGQSIFNPGPFTTSMGVGASTEGTPATYDVYFDQPETILLSLSGSLKDQDDWSGDDTMWGAAGTQINLKKLFESPSKSITINGDGKSESAAVVFTATKVKDLY